MGIHMKHIGSFKKTMGILDTLSGDTFFPIVNAFGQKGVSALREATPKDTGKTAESWKFRTDRKRGALVLNWYNTHTNEGANVAILLQYGHAGPGDVYVSGRDYINGAIEPVIKQMRTTIHLCLADLLATGTMPLVNKFL